VWSFVTYALLHADWGHVAINSLWLAAFGSPLAWRFGPVRFLVFSACGALGGSVLHLFAHSTDLVPMVGASAAISAHMAGACRFVFATGGPLRGLQGAGADIYRRPAAPLSVLFSDSRVIGFLAIWFGINFVFGAFAQESGLASGAVAWEAHIGGFIVGLFAFPLFDPVRAAPANRI
jgi:membrane associated rhomboid family serine protease